MDFTKVQERLGVEYKNTDHLHEALTHPSSLEEQDIGFPRSNEVLAWLGDALINCERST